jgi:hypothetical protein
MTRIRRPRRLALVVAVVAATGTGATLLATAPAAADQTLRLTTIAGQNTDLDLGEPGFSTGDTQVFVDDVQRGGRSVGSSVGSCTIASLAETRLVVHCVATLRFDDATSITAQGVNVENPQEGPGSFRWAVTGGTGRYRGAGGELVGTFRPGTDIVDVEVRLR